MKSFITIVLISFLCINCSKTQEVKTITTLELKELLDNKNIQLLDVRTPEEVEAGFIKTAIFANYFEDDFVIKSSKILDKKKPVYIYCRSGNRSGKAAELLSVRSFDVINVVGGYNQWKKENIK
jgi:rhodanese-related sulfurtransferase